MAKMKELDLTLRSLNKCGELLTQCGKQIVEVEDSLRALFSTAEPVEQAETPPEPISGVSAHEFSFVEVRQAFAEKARTGGAEAVKSLLAKYGASKLSEVAAEDYGKIMTDLEALQ